MSKKKLHQFFLRFYGVSQAQIDSVVDTIKLTHKVVKVTKEPVTTSQNFMVPTGDNTEVHLWFATKAEAEAIHADPAIRALYMKNSHTTPSASKQAEFVAVKPGMPAFSI